MAPGIYKSFRKAWDRNKHKYDKMMDTGHWFGYSKDFEDNDIENILSDINYAYKTKVFKHYSGPIKVIKNLLELTIEDVERECYQAMEAFVHNLNTMHSRGGGQVAFSSINLGCALSEAGRMVTKNLLLNLEAGLGNGETSIFPITIFLVKEGFNYNPEDKNYDLFKLACRVTGKRLYPKHRLGQHNS